MDCNRETILDELNDFEKRSNEISAILEDYLLKIAKTGDTMFPWGKLKPLLRKKLEFVLDEFYESCPTENLPALPNVEMFKFELLKAKLVEAVDSFQSAPFTIQRICELLTTPHKHYKRTDKFMRGLEKNILVVSTVEPKSPFDNEVNNNSAAVMNGMIPLGNEQTTKGMSINMSPSSKPSTCTSAQFENFGALTTAPELPNEIPTMHQEKLGSPESVIDVNSNSSSISDTTISDMDVGTYREVPVHGNDEDHCYSEHRNNYQEKSSSEMSLSMNHNNSSLENFSIFTPSSPTEVADVADIPQTDKCDILNAERSYDLNSSEEKVNLSNFQRNCNSPVAEGAMDFAPASVEEEESYSEDSSASSSSHSSGSDSRDFFRDVCNQSTEQDGENEEEETSSASFSNSSEGFIGGPPVHETKEEIVTTVESVGDQAQNTSEEHSKEIAKTDLPEVKARDVSEPNDLKENEPPPESLDSNSYAKLDDVTTSPVHNESSDEEEEDEREKIRVNACTTRNETTEHDDAMDLECAAKTEQDDLSDFPEPNEAEAMDED